MKIKYKIEEMFKLDGETKKEIPQDWNKEYEISVLRNGWSAILSSENNYLRTSTVKSFEIHGNVVKVTTKNTIYYLKPFISEVSND